jgi:hypothetical protein
MNINPYNLTTPHYDSYEDFYKFFEVQPKEMKERMPIWVFPPVEQPQVEVEKKEEVLEPEQDRESQ